MGRSNGYRATKKNAEQVAELRRQLSELRSDRWQQASHIMQCIVEITGGKGPSGAMVEPRACKYCGYFGHTRQHCAKRLEAEEAANEKENIEYWAAIAEAKARKLEAEKGPTIEEWLDQRGVVWYRDPVMWYMGPMAVQPGQDGGDGQWVVRNGITVNTAEE